MMKQFLLLLCVCILCEIGCASTIPTEESLMVLVQHLVGQLRKQTSFGLQVSGIMWEGAEYLHIEFMRKPLEQPPTLPKEQSTLK